MARDYAKEYREYHSRPEQVHKRSLRNQARAELGLHKGDPREADHKVPLSRGGSNARGNLRAVSREENRRKYDQVKHSSEPTMHSSLDPLCTGLRFAAEALTTSGHAKEALSKELVDRAHARLMHVMERDIPHARPGVDREIGRMSRSEVQSAGRDIGRTALRKLRQLQALDDAREDMASRGVSHTGGAHVGNRRGAGAQWLHATTGGEPVGNSRGAGAQWLHDTTSKARKAGVALMPAKAKNDLQAGTMHAVRHDRPASAPLATRILSGRSPKPKETPPSVPPPPPEPKEKPPSVPPPPPEPKEKPPSVPPPPPKPKETPPSVPPPPPKPKETPPSVPPPPPEPKETPPSVPPPPPEPKETPPSSAGGGGGATAPDTTPARAASHTPHATTPHVPHAGGHGWGTALAAGGALIGGGLLASHYFRDRKHNE